MFQFLSAIPYLLIIAVVVVACIYYQKQKRGRITSELVSGTNVLAHWTYTPEEWRRAVQDEFTWADGKGLAGEVFISPTSVYIRTDQRDHLIDLADNSRVVTHASFRGTSESPLKLRVRWKVVRRTGNGSTQTTYHKENYRIPVPRGASDAATKVVDYFTAQIERNPEAYTNVVSDDEPISLFGRDDSL